MTRLISPAGTVVSVADDKADRLAAWGFKPYGESESGKVAEGYSALKVADLKAEIERRNEGREGDALLSVEGKKADLIAILEADDAAADSGNGEPDDE